MTSETRLRSGLCLRFSLPQHLDALQREAVIYRPATCPRCGLAKLWGHGGYEGKADRRPAASGSLKPIPISRLFCQGCRESCSRLPGLGQRGQIVILAGGNGWRR